MQIFNKIEHQNAPSCVAVGCFDGIHIGHQKIISNMCTYAKENNLVSTVFTFPKSPSVLLGRTPERAIMTQSEKISKKLFNYLKVANSPAIQDLVLKSELLLLIHMS